MCSLRHTHIGILSAAQNFCDPFAFDMYALTLRDPERGKTSGMTAVPGGEAPYTSNRRSTQASITSSVVTPYVTTVVSI